MTAKATKIRIGLFTAGAAALLAITLIVFGGLRFWEGRDEYKVKFNDSVIGLAGGAQVFLNGIQVGTVTGIRVAPDDLGKVDVTIEVEEGTQIRADTRAMLQMAGITGLKVIDLRGGSLASPRLAPGAQIAQGETLLDKLELQAQTLVDQSTQLMARANQVVENLVAVSDPKTFAAMPEIMAQARLSAANLARATAGLDAMITDNRVAMRQTIASIGSTAKSAGELMDGQMSLLLGNATDLISDMKGLVRDNGSVVHAAVVDLRQASRSFKELAREVRQRPSRLLLGGTTGDRKLP